ncbi:DUF6107 family protein [Aquamicrobium defluvii]|uniref:Uncharacterized protein n=1 Tax=Aquamicrobium defluvii TaxID=69279 RepID=A0A011TEI6_9HYPH|nr:DUF6107 family protein [Aquamicrobium defluvii]EXL10074.1 hypothetical protein BG36_07870 [Aquamicrobium defluvii]EZQ16848.1 hypothetical protein CF98_37430 [Halopseudomonas bauzanensis]TDR36393.1 hypothetical protein DES43_10558 [Aquamicrobium defluvii]
MTDMSQGSWLWAAKGVGAIAGSAASLVYILPQGRREAASRFVVGVMCGVVFGGTAGLKVATDLGIEERIGSSEMVLMGSALASLCAWWALGFVLKFLGQCRPDRPRAGSDEGNGNES